MRGDQGTEPGSPFHRFLCRLVHMWGQKVEIALERRLQTSCPDPRVNARVHPFLGPSRRRGNKSLEMNMVSRYMARGGGFISLKDQNLQSLGVVPKHNSLGFRTSNEYTCRMLLKASNYMEDCLSQSTNVNFCFDAAFVAEEHAPYLGFRCAVLEHDPTSQINMMKKLMQVLF